MLYKYFSPVGTTRFLSTMALRLTPPDQFNDPFEMCPPIDVANVDELTAINNVTTKITSELLSAYFPKVKFSKKFREKFNSEVKAQKDSIQTLRLYAMTPPEILSLLKLALPQMRQTLILTLKESRKQFPKFQSNFQNLLHSTLREALGALCFTKNGNHPLMWAHYADEHKGAVIKFKTDRACFNRGDYNEDVGKFVDISYTKLRPVLNAASSKKAITILALSKAADWEYEEEMRFLLPLSVADKVIDNKYHLINIDPLSVESIILGCRASDDFINQVVETVRKKSDMSHVNLYKSEPCKKHYALNYVEL